MVSKIKVGTIYLKFVLRHIWEKDKRTDWEHRNMLRTPELGIWFKKQEAVGVVKKGETVEETVKKTFAENNYVNVYTVGLKLFVCKVWVEFQIKPTIGFKN